jgi:predicted nucleic acid-binding protein
MTVVLDTSVLVDHLRGDERARRVLAERAHAGEPLSASVLTKVELLAGVRADEEDRTRRLLEVLDWREVDDQLAERAGRLASRFVRSHPGVEIVDYVIAATVERLEAELLTRNRKHFPMFPDLTDPYGNE